VLFPTLYALLDVVDGSPLAAAGLVCSCLTWKSKPKNKTDLQNNSSSSFDNLQHYNNYLTRHSARQHRLSPARLPLCGATARWSQNKRHVSLV